MKYFLQILASLLYSSIFVGLLAVVTVYPMGWFFSLPVFWMIVVYLFFFSLFQGVISFAQALITTPYIWIVKGNSVALIIAILTVVAGLIRVSIGLWKIGPSGFWQVAATVIMTALIIEVIIGTCITLVNLKYGDEQ